MKTGRNDPCPCGSGKKYKHCCEGKVAARSAAVPPPEQAGQLTALFNARRYAELEANAQSVLVRYPAFGQGWRLLGIAQQMQGRSGLDALGKAAASLPQDAELHFRLGNAQHQHGLLREAVESFRAAARLRPGFAGSFLNLGSVLNKLGRHEEALAAYQDALKGDPSSDDAWHGIAHLQLMAGKMEEARLAALNALKLNPDNLEVRLLLANISRSEPGDENLEALMRLEEAARAGRRQVPQGIRIGLNFALGKSFDELRQYDRAFGYFAEGNRLKRATFEYDPAVVTRQFDRVMQVFDHEFLARLRGSGDPSDVPIFVLGMPRSGTTLVEQIIASHPDVFGAGELPDLTAIAMRRVGTVSGFPDNLAGLDRETLARWGGEYLAGLRQRAPDARRITDKMPDNFWLVGLIHLMLPNAKIIHVSRNPVDNCLSCFSLSFTGPMQYSYDLAELGRYYVDYSRLMAHWRSVLPPGAFLDVRYEDIVADQAGQARRIIDHCGLAWDEACLEFHQSKSKVNTASIVQVRKPVYASSVERWRSYEKHLGPLLEALGPLAGSNT